MAAHLVTCRWVGGGGGAPLNAHICRRWNQDLAADIDLDSESFGLNYPRTCSGTHTLFFIF